MGPAAAAGERVFAATLALLALMLVLHRKARGALEGYSQGTRGVLGAGTARMVLGDTRRALEGQSNMVRTHVGASVGVDVVGAWVGVAATHTQARPAAARALGAAT